MERMQASDTSTSAHTAAAASSSAEDDMMAQLMKELQSGGGGREEDFNKMLMGMMAQLTNKDILYEPMKELHDKFPAWMEKNRASTGKEDLERFEEQHRLVREIVGRFERKGYSDEDEDDREYIVERMQKVCLFFFFGTLGDDRVLEMKTSC
jgi:peroxin-19